VVVVVLLAQVVHVGGADERAPELAGDLHDPLVGLVLLGQAVALDLEVDVLGPEDLQQVVGVGACLALLTGEQALAEARGQAAGQGDDPLGVARDDVEVDGRLAAVQPVEEAGARELDEVAVALVGGGQQREVVVLVAAALGLVVDEVDLTAEDRLDAVLAGGLEVLDRAVHDAVVGQAQRGLAEVSRAFGQRVDLACTVEQRVLGVDVQMGAGWGRHGR
jgi:hypothetical protein